MTEGTHVPMIASSARVGLTKIVDDVSAVGGRHELGQVSSDWAVAMAWAGSHKKTRACKTQENKDLGLVGVQVPTLDVTIAAVLRGKQ